MPALPRTLPAAAAFSLLAAVNGEVVTVTWETDDGGFTQVPGGTLGSQPTTYEAAEDSNCGSWAWGQVTTDSAECSSWRAAHGLKLFRSDYNGADGAKVNDWPTGTYESGTFILAAGDVTFDGAGLGGYVAVAIGDVEVKQRPLCDGVSGCGGNGGNGQASTKLLPQTIPAASLAAFVGMHVTIRIVDDSSSGWGHIAVDNLAYPSSGTSCASMVKENTDYLGHDIPDAHVASVESAEKCSNICFLSTQGCVAWTWVKNGPTPGAWPDKVCFLKSAQGQKKWCGEVEQHMCDCCDSGLACQAPAPEPPPPAGCAGVVKQNTDYTGNDMAWHLHRDDIQSAEECSNVCFDTLGCLSWTWVKQTDSQYYKWCFLKGEPTVINTHNCCDSGTPCEGPAPEPPPPNVQVYNFDVEGSSHASECQLHGFQRIESHLEDNLGEQPVKYVDTGDSENHHDGDGACLFRSDFDNSKPDARGWNDAGIGKIGDYLTGVYESPPFLLGVGDLTFHGAGGVTDDISQSGYVAVWARGAEGWAEVAKKHTAHGSVQLQMYTISAEDLAHSVGLCATVRLVDDQVGAWGHIAIDTIHVPTAGGASADACMDVVVPEPSVPVPPPAPESPCAYALPLAGAPGKVFITQGYNTPLGNSHHGVAALDIVPLNEHNYWGPPDPVPADGSWDPENRAADRWAVRAVRGGVVYWTDLHCTAKDCGGETNMVIVDHQDGTWVDYSHVDPWTGQGIDRASGLTVQPILQVGAHVSTGDPVAWLGTTGTGGPHLHLSVHRGPIRNEHGHLSFNPYEAPYFNGVINDDSSCAVEPRPHHPQQLDGVSSIACARSCITENGVTPSFAARRDGASPGGEGGSSAVAAAAAAAGLLGVCGAGVAIVARRRRGAAPQAPEDVKTPSSELGITGKDWGYAVPKEASASATVKSSATPVNQSLPGAGRVPSRALGGSVPVGGERSVEHSRGSAPRRTVSGAPGSSPRVGQQRVSPTRRPRARSNPPAAAPTPDSSALTPAAAPPGGAPQRHGSSASPTAVDV